MACLPGFTAFFYERGMSQKTALSASALAVCVPQEVPQQIFCSCWKKFAGSIPFKRAERQIQADERQTSSPQAADFQPAQGHTRPAACLEGMRVVVYAE
jgi:hypothetical protein